MDSQKFAVLSTDANPIYSLLTPITAYLWSELIGYTPFVYIVGDVPGWIVEKTREARALVQAVAEIENVPRWRLAQSVRLFAGREPHFSDDAYLLMTDADMWPLSRDHFQARFDWSKELHIFNAWGMSPQETEYPMCYLGARARLWRELLGQDTVAGCCQTRDQLYISERIRRWPGFKDRTQKLRRPLDPRFKGFHMRYTDRIDKVEWRALRPGDVDTHLPKQRTQATWDLLSDLLKGLGIYRPWVQDYVNQARTFERPA